MPMSSSSFSGSGQPGMLSVVTMANGTVVAGGADGTGGRIWVERPPS